MSSLDRLCELLDERGVKYERRSFVGYNYNRDSVEYVIWRGVGGLEFNAIHSVSDPDMLYIDNTIISPEDAVDATVRRGTCELPKTPDWCTIERYGIVERYGVAEWRTCSACGSKVLASPARYCPSCGRTVAE